LASRTPQSLQTSLARLAGADARAARETRIFRITVTSSDGKKCSVNVRISPKKVYPTTLKQLANELRVKADDLDAVLDDWTHEQLVDHLSQFPAAVLDSLPRERRFLEHLAHESEPTDS
jgi:hypothetical protein